uniref:Cytochrome b-c1 complex subunit 9 n=1 Tax=Melopsittacus undulatus TaxID=13146 RepID=A0A8V5H5T0_MELUD
MALLRQAYSSLFRRTSTFALTIVLGAVLFERVFDQGADALFEHLNEGKLWLPHPWQCSRPGCTQGLGAAAPVEGVPACGRGWSWMSFKVPSTQTRLGFCAISKDDNLDFKSKALCGTNSRAQHTPHSVQNFHQS